MKYDVYKGTREDFENAKGVRIGRRCDENDIAEIIRKSYKAHSAMSPVIM